MLMMKNRFHSLRELRTILDICLRVEGVNFTDVPNDDTTLAFLKSKPEPESVKRKTSSKRRVKKKVTLSADDNIISDDLDTTLELGKSISKTKAKEAEATRQVHATHARIVTESVPEPTKRIKSGKVNSDPPKKLKGVPSLTPEEQVATNIMQALKERKKTSKSHPGTSTKPGVLDEEKDITKENVIH
ncbi:hypothetical protein Tco_0290093 [Tanacetum coccineum]